MELARGVASRFTFDPGNDIYPVWSPDGSRIVFGSDREGGVLPPVSEAGRRRGDRGTCRQVEPEHVAARVSRPTGASSSTAASSMAPPRLGSCPSWGSGRCACSIRRCLFRAAAKCRRMADGWRTTPTNRDAPRSTCRASPRRVAASGRSRKTAADTRDGGGMVESCSITPSTSGSWPSLSGAPPPRHGCRRSAVRGAPAERSHYCGGFGTSTTWRATASGFCSTCRSKTRPPHRSPSS